MQLTTFATLPWLVLLAPACRDLARIEKAHSDARWDPAAWGENHAGEATPEYTTGDEYLFCHRDELATRCQDEPHARTLRSLPALLEENSPWREVEELEFAARSDSYILGNTNLRIVRKSGYGRLSLHSSRWKPGTEKNDHPQRVGKHAGRWDDIHARSTKKHRRLSRSQLCDSCHDENLKLPVEKTLDGGNKTCETRNERG